MTRRRSSNLLLHYRLLHRAPSWVAAGSTSRMQVNSLPPSLNNDKMVKGAKHKGRLPTQPMHVIRTRKDQRQAKQDHRCQNRRLSESHMKMSVMTMESVKGKPTRMMTRTPVTTHPPGGIMMTMRTRMTGTKVTTMKRSQPGQAARTGAPTTTGRLARQHGQQARMVPTQCPPSQMSMSSMLMNPI